MTVPLECHQLVKAFNAQPVLHTVSLTVQRGELVALLGPSGCGKTTTLRLIAGFEWPDEGTITISGRMVAGKGANVPTEQRRVGMVFQEYALFPHLDVLGNVTFGLHGSAKDKAKRAADMLALVGLEGLEKRMPYALSGGQQQRVALARALAPEPEILLLDEPFSNLDAALRMQVRGEVHSILKSAGITGVFVTHDQEEALSLADSVAVMMNGRIAQFAAPETLYHHPADRKVAAFVGEANFIPAQAQGATAACALGQVALLEAAYGEVELLLRPEQIRLDAEDGAEAIVVWREFYGHDQRVGLRLADGTALIARADAARRITVNERLRVGSNAPLKAFAAVRQGIA